MSFPATFRSMVARVCVRMTNRYRPERYYMRGPGPTYAARLQSAVGGRQSAVGILGSKHFPIADCRLPKSGSVAGL